MVTIIRNGEQLYKHNKDIMVGDLVVVDNGMEIPADGFLIQASDLAADESAMTGETLPIRKDIYENCLKEKDDTL